MVYLFSGLGADERVFQNLDLLPHQVSFVRWLPPNPKETFAEYAKRISETIVTPNPVFIGLSFGGMMAIEVAKHISTKQLIVLASAKTKHELPFYFRIAGKLKLHKLIPTRLLKRANLFTFWLLV